MITVRKIQPKDDFTTIEELQRKAWQLDDLTITPSHVLQVVSNFGGGFLAGAFFKKPPESTEELIGFVLGFATKDRKVQHSHQVAVHPDWQNGKKMVNVGMLLKQFQKEQALKDGVEILEWTFEPLRGTNANLNFHKLGVRLMKYLPEAYGNTSEVGIYAGLPTDRLLVRWFLKEKKSNGFSIVEALSVPAINNANEINGSAFRVRIPLDIDDLKSRNLKQAKEVSINVRDIFLRAEEQGYSVEDFIYMKDTKENFYLFGRK